MITSDPEKTAAELFVASRMKLQRAEGFILELETELQRYKESRPGRGFINTELTPPQFEFTLDPIGLLPGTIIGDAIHNLRSALDLMASELARIKGLNDKDVYFPFAATASEFPDAVKRRGFHKAGDDAVALLMQFQPYRGGNEALRAIHDLDIQDKHTALIPNTSSVTAAFGAVYNINDLTQHSVSMDVVEVHYVFPKESPFAGERIIETLQKLVELVNGILEAFASLVAVRNAKG